MRRVRGACVGLAVLSVAFLLAAPAAAQDSCEAEVHARPGPDEIHDKYAYKVFAVDVETGEECATVYVDFVATERLFNGEVIETTRRGSRKVSAETTYKVKYRVERDSELADWEFTVSRCVVCDR